MPDIDLVAMIDAMNDWGKQYWGLVLVLFAINHFVNNIFRSTRNIAWTFRTRRIRNTSRLAATGTPFQKRASLTGVGFGNGRPQPTLREMIERSSDFELASAMSHERLERLNGNRAYLRATS